MKTDERDWRKLCAMVAEERDPERLSRLVEQLIQALDARREELDRNERQQKPASDSASYET